MAKSTSDNARRNTWRAVLIGAAVPFAVLAAAPAVSAAETGTDTGVSDEQVPDLPVDAPADLDQTALLDLSQCLTDLQAALADDAPVPAELREQVGDLPVDPADPGVEVPDVSALNEICQELLAQVTDAAADVPAEDPVPVPAG